jgi:plasmid maintenance system antidote protein VapI
MIKPPHPGETIKEDYIVPPGMSVNRLAAPSVSERPG